MIDRSKHISHATLTSVEAVSDIYDACRLDMQSNGILQWIDEYPNIRIAREDIAERQLYQYTVGKSIAGIITLNEHQDDEYQQIPWQYDQGKALVIHRLAVHPQHQKQGIARSLMDYAEQKYAPTNGYLHVRLDTYSENKRSLKFYLARGYEPRGEVYFPLREKPFVCMEKKL